MKHLRKIVFVLPIVLFALLGSSCMSTEEKPSGSKETCDHTYSDIWEWNEKYHFHRATCEHKDLTKDEERHIFGDWELTVTEKEEQRICKVCKYVETRPVSALECNHTYGAWKVDETPTVDKEGKLSRVCSKDSSHIDEKTLPKLNAKDYTYKVTNESTCMAKGSATYTYKLDKESFEFGIELPLALCVYGAWEVVKEPSKEEAGQLKRVCPLNEDHFETFELPVLNEADYSYTSNAPSCLDAGKEEYVFTKDGKKFTFEISIPATDHTYEQKFDSSKHWNQAICEHSTIKKDIEDHSIVNDVCEVCGYEKSEDNSVLYTLNSTEDGYIATFNPEFTGNSIFILDTYENLPVEEIQTSSFDGTNVFYITIPASIKKIEAGVFEGFIQLIDVYYDGEIEDWCAIEFEDKYANPMAQASAFYQRKNTTWEETKSINIPDTVEMINPYQFLGFEHVLEISIPSTMRSISKEAFANCTSLEELVLPDSLEYIGRDILANTNLVKFTVPYLVESYIGYYFGATSYSNQASVMKSIEEITITTAASLGNLAFYNLGSLKKLVLPNTLKQLGKTIVLNCSNLNYLEFNNGYYLGNEDNPYLILIKMIDKTATSFEIPGETKFIYDEAFKNAKITEIELPEGLIEIEEGAFYESALTKIVIPDGIDRIKAYTFYSCASLEEVVLPADLTNIANDITSGAFRRTQIKKAKLNLGAIQILSAAYLEELTLLKGEGSINLPSYPNLQKVILSSDISSIGSGVMTACEKLEYNIENNIAYLGSEDNPYLFLISAMDKTIEDGDIPLGTKHIYEEAFYNCTQLRSITLPYNITTIGDKAFKGCESLLYVDIPYRVASIGNEAFMDNTNLEYISFTPYGSSLKSVGDSAFAYCSSLTSLTLPDSITYIGYYILKGCASLKGLSVPFVGQEKNHTRASSVSLFGYFFGESSFDGGVLIRQAYNSSLTPSQGVRANIPETLKTVVVRGGVLKYGAFENCSMIENIHIYEGVTADSTSGNSNANIFKECQFKNVTLPASFLPYKELTRNAEKVVLTSGEELFYSTAYGHTSISLSSNLKEIVLPETMKILGEAVFQNCSNLTKIHIPSQVVEIGEKAFENCSSLQSLVLPEGLTSIGKYAFRGCTSLSYIVLPSTLETIDEKAFNDNIQQSICLRTEQVPESWDSQWNINASARLYYNVEEVVEIDNVYYIIKDGVAWAGGVLFTNLTEIKIDKEISYEGLTYPVKIAKGILSNLESLEKITLPFIGEDQNSSSTSQIPFGYVFGADDYNENSTKVPESLTSITITGGSLIPGYCFSGLTHIEEVILDGEISSLGENTFMGCSSLKRVTISNQVTELKVYVFHSCTSLEYIIVPTSVVSIASIFNSTSPKKTIYYEGSEEDWNKIDLSKDYNGYVSRMNIYYYSEDPVEEGNYWHYVDGIPTKWQA